MGCVRVHYGLRACALSLPWALVLARFIFRWWDFFEQARHLFRAGCTAGGVRLQRLDVWELEPALIPT